MKEHITVKVTSTGCELYEYERKGWKIVSWESIGNSHYIVNLERDIPDKEDELRH